MLSHIFDRISFWSLALTIVLMPLFFLPATGVAPETAKGALLVVGLAVAIISWAAARFSDGKISVPKSYIWLSVLFVLLATLLSSVFSSVPSVSFFGVMFDIGSFWFIFAGFALMFFSAIIINNNQKLKTVLTGTILSFSLVLLFQILRIALFKGENPIDLSFGGIPFSRTANLIGTWSSFGIVSSLFAFISLFLVEFFKFDKKWIKYFLYAFAVFSLIMVVLVNISLVWILLGVFSIVIFAYKVAISQKKEGDEQKREFPAFSFVFVLVALLFLMSGRFIGGVLPQALNLYDVEVGPSLATTIKTTFEALKNNPVFGIGPNRFLEVWAMHKPVEVNLSNFWDAPFTYGSGLITTFTSTTGVLGILAWFLFVLSLIYFGVKFLVKNMFEESNKEVVLVFLIGLYLLFASFFYASGLVIILFAMVFFGIFIGIKNSNKENGSFNIFFLDDPRKSLFSILFLFFLMLGTAGITFKYVEKFASAFPFAYVGNAQDIDKAITKIEKAVLLNPNDFYFRTYSQVYLAKMSSLVSKQEELTEEEKEALRVSFDKVVSGANSAVSYNQNNYINHVALGNVYASVATLGVEGSYENAIEAYKKASALNPKNPGIKKEIGQAYFLLNNLEEAKNYLNESLTLKPNYFDGLILMSRVEKDLGNSTSAISYAEQALRLSPNNKSVSDYVNSLRGVSVNNTLNEESNPAPESNE